MFDDIVLTVGRTREKVELNKDDTGDFIRFTVKNPDASLKDLTGWGGRVIAFSSDSGTTYMVSGSITVITGADGTCKYTVTGTDTDTGGRFPARLILTSGTAQSTVSGWEILVMPFSSTPVMNEYCTYYDVVGDMNANSLLKLRDYAPEDIRKKIQAASATIDKKIGSQSASDEVIVQLCKYMVLSDIGSGLPTAQADGEKRVSLLGVVAKWDKYIADTLTDYGYGSPTPLFTSP